MDQLLTRPMNIITRCTGLFRDDALADTGLTSGQATYLLRICHKPGLTQRGELEKICHGDAHTQTASFACFPFR